MKSLAINSVAFGVLALAIAIPQPLAAGSTYKFTSPAENYCLEPYAEYPTLSTRRVAETSLSQSTLQVDLSVSQLVLRPLENSV